MKSFKQLTKGFAYVNPDIENNFPLEKVRGEVKIYHFDKRMSSEDVITEMAKDGYVPANLSELLTVDNKGEVVVALGSVCSLGGGRQVAYLYGFSVDRGLYLVYYDGDWDDDCRFAAVRKLDLDPKTIEPSGTLTLEKAIELVKKEGYIVYKQM